MVEHGPQDKIIAGVDMKISVVVNIFFVFSLAVAMRAMTSPIFE
jgi:hypothetical protein